MQHTFLYISLPLFCTTTTQTFQKLNYGGNVVRVLVHFFLLPLIFTLHGWPRAFLISFFVTGATKFSNCSSNKKCLLCFFISCSRSYPGYQRFFSRAAGIFGVGRSYERRKTWQKPETALEKSLAPRVSRSLSRFLALSFASLPPTLSFSLSFSFFVFQICGNDN